ncbi:hypothetical protein VYU27_000617 [Nannochloropsis oceanica]
MPIGFKLLAMLVLCTFFLIVSGRTNVLRGGSSRELRRDTKTTLAGDKGSANANKMEVTIDKKKKKGAGAVAEPVESVPTEKGPKEGKADMVEKDDEYDADMDDDNMIDGLEEGEGKDVDEDEDEGKEPTSEKNEEADKEPSDPATATALEDGREGKESDATAEGMDETKDAADDKGEVKEEGDEEQDDESKQGKMGLLHEATTTKGETAPVAEAEIGTDTDKTTSGTGESKKGISDEVKEVDGNAAATTASEAVAESSKSKSGPPKLEDAEDDKDTKADAAAADASSALAEGAGETNEKDVVGEADVGPADSSSSSSSSNDKKKSVAEEEITATTATDEGKENTDNKADENKEGKAEASERKRNGEAAGPEKKEKGVDSATVEKPTDDGKVPAAPDSDYSNVPDPASAEQEKQQQKREQDQQQQEQHQQQQQQQPQQQVEVTEVKEVKEGDVAPVISESSTATGTAGTGDACDPQITCNGHGKCNEDGSCRCYPPYTGSACLRDACLDIWDCNECVGSNLGCYFSDGECRGDGLISPEESTCRPAWLASVMAYMQFAFLFGVVLLVAGGMVWRSRRASMVAGGREGGLGGFIRMPTAGGGPEGEGENWHWDPEEDSVELLKQSGEEGGREGGREGQEGGKGKGIYALIRPSSKSSPVRSQQQEEEKMQQHQTSAGLGAGVTSRRDSGGRKELQSGEDLFAELGMEAQPQFNLKRQNDAGPPGQQMSCTRSSRLSAAGTSPVKGGSTGGEGLAPGWMDDEDLDI